MPDVERVFVWDDAEGPDVAAGRALSNLTTARKVAVEPLALRYFEYSYLKRHLGQAEVVSAEPLVWALRRRKDPAEVAALRAAVRIAEAALEALVSQVRVGMREREIATRLAGELLRLGGEGISFGPIVLAGARSALPHGVAGDHEVAAGELLLIDYGTSCQGYHADVTRTFVVGAEPDEAQRSAHRAVLDANEAGRGAVRPGVTAHEVHHVCQADLFGPRWEAFTKYRTGHGLGLDIHEPPSVAAGNQSVLEAGMVFTIEPGLYREGWGGIRIEDDVLVTAGGAESLTSSSRELRVLGA
jgi:Xaa-Pro dipeptidase